MNVLDLFSGIGGFSLGLERAGMRTVAFCEIEPYARSILKQHWPLVPCYEDVRSLTADRLRADGIIPDVICGGFPCQDISLTGTGAGLVGARSGLWSEYARLIEEIGPQWVIIENVAALRSRGLEIILGKLATLGYDAEWHCVPAAAIGAPHRRDRVWIVAHTSGVGKRKSPEAANPITAGGKARPVAGSDGEPLAYANRQPPVWTSIPREERYPWSAEPALGRVVDGVPHKVVEPELRALGIAVVPQIPQLIGEAIMALLPSNEAQRSGSK